MCEYLRYTSDTDNITVQQLYLTKIKTTTAKDAPSSYLAHLRIRSSRQQTTARPPRRTDGGQSDKEGPGQERTRLQGGTGARTPRDSPTTNACLRCSPAPQAPAPSSGPAAWGTGHTAGQGTGSQRQPRASTAYTEMSAVSTKATATG